MRSAVAGSLLEHQGHGPQSPSSQRFMPFSYTSALITPCGSFLFSLVTSTSWGGQPVEAYWGTRVWHAGHLSPACECRTAKWSVPSFGATPTADSDLTPSWSIPWTLVFFIHEVATLLATQLFSLCREKQHNHVKHMIHDHLPATTGPAFWAGC